MRLCDLTRSLDRRIDLHTTVGRVDKGIRIDPRLFNELRRFQVDPGNGRLGGRLDARNARWPDGCVPSGRGIIPLRPRLSRRPAEGRLPVCQWMLPALTRVGYSWAAPR